MFPLVTLSLKERERQRRPSMWATLQTKTQWHNYESFLTSLLDHSKDAENYMAEM